MTFVEDYAMLDIEEVRARLRVSDSTIRRLIRDGKIRAYRIGRQLKFKPEELDAYIESALVRPGDDEIGDASEDAYRDMKRHAPEIESEAD
jgi:excisionase family DNA binding protein